eukprot:9744570-Ditylum_brightwellii.AAC.1
MGRRKQPPQSEKQLKRKEKKDDLAEMKCNYVLELMKEGKNQKHPLYVIIRQKANMTWKNSIILDGLQRSQ